jgi:hypothetical protein
MWWDCTTQAKSLLWKTCKRCSKAFHPCTNIPTSNAPEDRLTDLFVFFFLLHRSELVPRVAENMMDHSSPFLSLSPSLPPFCFWTKYFFRTSGLPPFPVLHGLQWPEGGVTGRKGEQDQEVMCSCEYYLSTYLSPFFHKEEIDHHQSHHHVQSLYKVSILSVRLPAWRVERQFARSGSRGRGIIRERQNTKKTHIHRQTETHTEQKP